MAGGGAGALVLFQACGVPEHELFVESSNEIPEDLVSGLDNWYATVCRQCSSTEGIVVRVMEGRAKKVEGNVDFPLNRGAHSARCDAGVQALYHPDRISAPLLRVGERGEGRWEEISWTDAIQRVALQLESLGDPKEAVLITPPTRSYSALVADRFMARLGGKYLRYEPMETTNVRRAIKQVFNQDRMPDLDLENSKVVLSFGADFLNTWMSPVRYGRGYGHFRQGDRDRGTLIHVDSRFSMTGANADELVFVKPGQEGLFALSIASVIIEDGLGKPDAVDALTDGGRVDVSRFAPDRVADVVGVGADKIRHVAHEFANQGPAAIAVGGGTAAAHTNGYHNMVAVYSLNHLVGSVNQSGGVVFNPDSPLPDIPTAAGANLNQWQELVGQMNSGQIKVLMVKGADPMYALPSALGFRAASFDVPFIFSFSSQLDDTTAMADLILPENNYLEDWDIVDPEPGPGYQSVGFQQPVVRPFFEPRGVHLGTKNFAEVLMGVAQELGIDLGLPGTFRELLEQGLRKLFDLNRGSVRATDFRAFWNGVLQRGGWWNPAAIAARDSVTPPALPAGIDASPSFDGVGQFTLIPFSSTSLMEGQTADLPWLQATPDPISTATWRTWVEINMKVAEDMNIREGDMIRITSGFGGPDVEANEGVLAIAYPHPGVPPDVVCVPLGQGRRGSGRYAKGRGGNIMNIIAPNVDQETGALAWAATKVRIEKTGDWVRLPKAENTNPDLATDEGQHVLKITPMDT